MDRNPFFVWHCVIVTHVAPRRGAWIEIALSSLTRLTMLCRTPQGCVDRNPVLRNSVIFAIDVAPRRGAWIEIDFT